MRRKSHRQALARDLGNCAGHLDSGRAAADDREGEEAVAFGRVGGKLRALEGDEDAPPDAGRVLDALEAGRDLGPFVVAEVGVGRARGEHEIVVGDAHRIDLHEPFASINGADLGHQHGRVLLLA